MYMHVCVEYDGCGCGYGFRCMDVCMQSCLCMNTHVYQGYVTFSLHTYMASFDSSQTPRTHSNNASSNYEANYNSSKDCKDDEIFTSGTFHWHDNCCVD